MTDGGFIDMINSFFGGAVTTLIGAFTGRLMWHSGEVKLGNRRFFGKELLWEIPVSVGMAEFGWTVPCLVADDGELIAGHGRVLAATQLGLTDAPVIVLGHLTEAQRRAYRIADNKLTELGTWDEALLPAELNDLLAEDFDLSLVGFSDGELDKLLAYVAEDDGEEGGTEGSVPPDYPPLYMTICCVRARQKYSQAVFPRLPEKHC